MDALISSTSAVSNAASSEPLIGYANYPQLVKSNYISDSFSMFNPNLSFPLGMLSESSTTQAAQDQINERKALAVAVIALREFSSESFFPGERVSTIENIFKKLDVSDEILIKLSERIVAERHFGISESAKVALIRFSVDHVSPRFKNSLIKFLLSQLKSNYPARSSAAASALREVSDAFLVPVLKAASAHIKWRFAKNEISRTIEESS